MPKLVMCDPSGREQIHDIPPQPQVWGRGEDSDVILGSRSVIRHHMRIYSKGERIFVEDLSGGQGLKVDGKPVSGTFELKPGQEMEAGVFTFHVFGTEVKREEAAEQPAGPRLPQLRGTRGPTKGVLIELRAGSNEVGRDQSNYIVIEDPSISRLHARLTVQGGSVELVDLRSSNGTFVNQRRVENAQLRHWDLVRFGNMEFRLVFPDQPVPRRLDRKKLILLSAGGVVFLLLVLGVSARMCHRPTAVDDAPRPPPELPLEVRVEQHLRAARLAIEGLNWKEAEREAEAAFQLHPISTEARKLKEQIAREVENQSIYNEGNTLYDLNKWRDAYQEFKKIPEDSVYFKKVKYKLSDCQKKLSNYHLTEGRSFFSAQQFDKAQEHFIEYMKLNPCDQQVYKQWLKKSEDRMKYFRMRFTPYAYQCQQAAPEQAGPLTEMDQLEMLKVRYSQPDIFEAMKLYFRGKGKLAAEALKRLKSSRDQATAAQADELERQLLLVNSKYNEGLSLLNNNQFDAARESFTQVLAYDEKLMPPGVKSNYRESIAGLMAEKLYKEGLAQFERQEYEKAFDLWKKCLEVHPDSTSCNQGMLQLENVAEEALTYGADLETKKSPSAINVWKNVMRITRPESLPYKKAQIKLKEYGVNP
jgi:pSer/pThr/pTyr-binding forkhead associated (FHA) protein/tetratricopeptide (TPR) repeat protein